MQSLRQRLLLLPEKDLLASCVVDVFRGSGPGGQKRNKTESAVRVRHLESGLTGQSSESRSQHENRARALRRLREAAAFELRCELSLEGYQVPDTLEQWLRPKHERIGPKHPRYWAAIAELLDLVVATRGAIGETARATGVTTSALTKLIFKDPRVARRVNELRHAHGLKPLSDPR